MAFLHRGGGDSENCRLSFLILPKELFICWEAYAHLHTAHASCAHTHHTRAHTSHMCTHAHISHTCTHITQCTHVHTMHTSHVQMHTSHICTHAHISHAHMYTSHTCTHITHVPMCAHRSHTCRHTCTHMNTHMHSHTLPCVYEVRSCLCTEISGTLGALSPCVMTWTAFLVLILPIRTQTSE